MTDRKPYEPNWPHGYETRDGRKVTARAVHDRSPVWELAGVGFFTTDSKGISVPFHPDYAVFCTPAPVAEQVEMWGVLDRWGEMHGPWFTKDTAEDSCSSPESRVVHMREVGPGDMTAEQIEAAITAIYALADKAEHVARYCGLKEAAALLRSASRGEA